MNKIITKKEGLSQLELGILIDETTSNHERTVLEPLEALMKHVISLCHHHGMANESIANLINMDYEVSDEQSIKSTAKIGLLLNDIAYINGFDLTSQKISITMRIDEFISETYSFANEQEKVAA